MRIRKTLKVRPEFTNQHKQKNRSLGLGKLGEQEPQQSGFNLDYTFQKVIMQILLYASVHQD